LRYPKTQQDITLEVSSTLAHAKLSDNLRTSLSEASKQHGYRCELSNGDIFVAEGSDKKRVTFRITLAHPDRTLTTDEATKVIDELSRRAVAEFSAVRI
jgi:phenylalanyl-tRNA synthetase beta subunit